jgi:hypothetical protein
MRLTMHTKRIASQARTELTENLTQRKKRPTNEEGRHICSRQLCCHFDRFNPSVIENTAKRVLSYANEYASFPLGFRVRALCRPGQKCARNCKIDSTLNRCMIRNQHDYHLWTMLSVSALWHMWAACLHVGIHTDMGPIDSGALLRCTLESRGSSRPSLTNNNTGHTIRHIISYNSDKTDLNPMEIFAH